MSLLITYIGDLGGLISTVITGVKSTLNLQVSLIDPSPKFPRRKICTSAHVCMHARTLSEPPSPAAQPEANRVLGFRVGIEALKFRAWSLWFAV